MIEPAIVSPLPLSAMTALALAVAAEALPSDVDADMLVARGFIVRTKRGVAVTPDGLAAVLGEVPIEALKTATPVAEDAAVRRDVPTRPSRAPRTSAARSARRDRAPS